MMDLTLVERCGKSSRRFVAATADVLGVHDRAEPLLQQLGNRVQEHVPSHFSVANPPDDAVLYQGVDPALLVSCTRQPLRAAHGDVVLGVDVIVLEPASRDDPHLHGRRALHARQALDGVVIRLRHRLDVDRPAEVHDDGITQLSVGRRTRYS